MIGRLQGILLSKEEQGVVLEAGGVGYEVEVPASTLLTLPPLGMSLVLHTHLVIREDAHHLYGFAELREREMFRLLLKANGIGPKLALGLLSALDSQALAAAVSRADLNTLVKLPGVGRKTAERLVLDLRDRLKEWELRYGAVPVAPHEARAAGAEDQQQEAETALIGLGYKPQEAARAVVLAAAQLQEAGKVLATAALVRLALRELGRVHV
ncbi:MAG: Holliday junction branch migration protein RuvA [Pseudomonadales bacterium]|jgi:Holliday junction DNA helicase RuvA|nr:Holliday junction branch migration protein RuvA [Pseudomonadales bacterium]